MVLENLHGQMEDAIKETTKTILKKVLAFSYIQMDECLKGTLLKVNDTVMES